MEALITRLFVHNWQRKAVALVTAIIIWLFVNHSITATKIIPNVPVRIVNIPPEKTILKMLPNGILSKRITLTLSGTKGVIEELEPGDLEVLIDATGIDHDNWIAQITKKNIISLNPSIDLLHHLTQLSYNEFVIKIRTLITDKIPVTILPPTGEPPHGYEFLDIWPQKLTQTVCGPEEEIHRLKTHGLELTFDLNEITKSDLDGVKTTYKGQPDDEVSFIVPNKWKQIAFPLRQNSLEELNDPEAQNLRIDFLRKEFLPIERTLPIQIFYPAKTIATINPETYSMGDSPHIQQTNGLYYLTTPLYIKDVSRAFLDIVRDRIELVIAAAPKNEKEVLEWSVILIDTHDLEDSYTASAMANTPLGKNAHTSLYKRRESLLRKRFRDYCQRLTLYTSKDQKLNLNPVVDGTKIIIN